jgi:hypothetical protein
MMPRILILALVLALAGCGTNVKSLVERNGELTRQADWLLAEDVSARAQSLYRAEAERGDACAEIDRATTRRFEDQEFTFMEGFLSDLIQLAVLIVPVGPVEACAAAQARYGEAVALSRHPAADGSSEIAAAPVQ